MDTYRVRDAIMGTKAFWRSKTFWAGIVSIITGISIIVQTGSVDGAAIASILAGVGAIVGRQQATMPLGIKDAAPTVDAQGRAHL